VQRHLRTRAHARSAGAAASKRLSATQASQQQQFERDLRAVFTAGAGVMTLTVIGPTSAAALGAAVMEGAAAAWIALAAAEAEGIALSRQTVKMALLRAMRHSNRRLMPPQAKVPLPANAYRPPGQQLSTAPGASAARCKRRAERRITAIAKPDR
jgi:hypothetical protein